MILIPIIESIDEILNDMPAVINKLETSVSVPERECAEFISRLEAVSSKYRFPITGQLSVIRGKIICGAPKESAANLSRKDRQASEKRFMLTQLESAYNCINSYLDGERKVIGECERLVCQMSARLVACGALINTDSPNITGSALMALAARDKELMPILAHVVGLAGAPNTNILFEKTMSLAGIYEKE